MGVFPPREECDVPDIPPVDELFDPVFCPLPAGQDPICGFPTVPTRTPPAHGGGMCSEPIQPEVEVLPSWAPWEILSLDAFWDEEEGACKPTLVLELVHNIAPPQSECAKFYVDKGWKTNRLDDPEGDGKCIGLTTVSKQIGFKGEWLHNAVHCTADVDDANCNWDPEYNGGSHSPPTLANNKGWRTEYIYGIDTDCGGHIVCLRKASIPLCLVSVVSDVSLGSGLGPDGGSCKCDLFVEKCQLVVFDDRRITDQECGSSCDCTIDPSCTDLFAGMEYTGGGGMMGGSCNETIGDWPLACCAPNHTDHNGRPYDCGNQMLVVSSSAPQSAPPVEWIDVEVEVEISNARVVKKAPSGAAITPLNDIFVQIAIGLGSPNDPVADGYATMWLPLSGSMTLSLPMRSHCQDAGPHGALVTSIAIDTGAKNDNEQVLFDWDAKMVVFPNCIDNTNSVCDPDNEITAPC